MSETVSVPDQASAEARNHKVYLLGPSHMYRPIAFCETAEHATAIAAGLRATAADPALVPSPGSAAGQHGMAIANLSARIIYALQKADWMDSDVDNEDLSHACQIIADVIAGCESAIAVTAAAHALIAATEDGGGGSIRLPDRDSTRLLLKSLSDALDIPTSDRESA